MAIGEGLCRDRRPGRGAARPSDGRHLVPLRVRGRDLDQGRGQPAGALPGGGDRRGHLVGVAPFGFVEDVGDYRRGVVDHRRGQPLAGRDGRREGLVIVVGCHDVGGLRAAGVMS